jgi:hypothetical protein
MRLCSSGRGAATGRESITDGPKSCEIVYVTGQRGYFGHGHLGVECGETVARALFTREYLHPFGVQAQ